MYSPCTSGGRATYNIVNGCNISGSVLAVLEITDIKKAVVVIYFHYGFMLIGSLRGSALQCLKGLFYGGYMCRGSTAAAADDISPGSDQTGGHAGHVSRCVREKVFAINILGQPGISMY